MENQQFNQITNIWERSKMLIKGFIIGFLILIMLIPVAMLSELVTEREQRQNEVTEEVSSKWAYAQNLTGPVIVLPYMVKSDSANAMIKRNLYLLPERFNINGEMFPEVRHRSLYSVTLYRSQMQLDGAFDPSYIQNLGIADENILWNEAQVMIGINDARGLEEEVKMKWGSATYILEAGLPQNNLITEGLSSTVSFSKEKIIPFHLSISIKGSTHLYFTPVGKTTEVNLASSWNNPAFDGQYLPSVPPEVTDKGFSAKWKILQVSRGYPQAWKDANAHDLAKSSFGVKLIQPTDGYAKTKRSIKYAVLIIALTFTIFFFVEIFQKRRVHPLQYILVGIALCVFYTLLLSISEYTGFNTAYVISSVATVSLISTYVWGIFKKGRIVAGFTASLGGLYLYIFVLIQLQDYALVFGSIGLFIILAIIMYFSRKIDWYSSNKTISSE